MPTLSEVIATARGIVGTQADKALASLNPKDEDVEAEMAEAVEELNEVAGTAAGLKEKTFSTVAGQQEYVISTTIGTDVKEIEDVRWSAAHMTGGVLSNYGETDAAGNVVYDGSIPVGLQGEVMEVIEGMERFRHMDRFAYEIAYNEAGVKVLRLFPSPGSVYAAWCRYTTTAASADTLPAEAETALVAEACRAIYQLMMNRWQSTPVSPGAMPSLAGDNRLKALEKGRDYYAAKHARLKVKLRGRL